MMTEKIEKKLKKKITLDKIGSFYFYDNFIVSEINEGVIIDLDIILQFTFKHTKKYFPPNVPFVFISNRINSYSLNPTIHYETAKVLKNTKGYAVVAYDDINKKVAKLEMAFLKIPTKIFNSLDDAIKWVDELTITN